MGGSICAREGSNTLGAVTQADAEQALSDVLSDVRRGIWQPQTRAATPVAVTEEPTFHVFASTWFEQHRREVAPRTSERWANWLTNHLLPAFADLPLSAITPARIDEFKLAKIQLREPYEAASPAERSKMRKPLSNDSINGAVRMLGRVLSQAVSYGDLPTNPVERVRPLKAAKPKRTWLEPAEISVLLEAAGLKRARGLADARPLIAVLILAGLRSTEACELTWSNIDLANARLTVEDSTTDAGRRRIDLSPALLSELKAHEMNARNTDADAPVFTTRRGAPIRRHHVRTTLAATVLQGNAWLVDEGQPPITGLSCHSLRRTYAALLFEAGASPRYAMSQLGHTDANMSLSVYAKVMDVQRDTGAKMDALISATIGEYATSEAAPLSETLTETTV